MQPLDAWRREEPLALDCMHAGQRARLKQTATRRFLHDSALALCACGSDRLALSEAKGGPSGLRNSSFGVDGLDPSAAPRARKTSALIVELWRARTMGDIAASVRT